MGANSDLFYINTSFCAGRRWPGCAWGERRPPRAGTEEWGEETGPAACRANRVQPPAGACRGTGRLTPTHTRVPSPRRFCCQVESATDTQVVLNYREERKSAVPFRALSAPSVLTLLPSSGSSPLCGLDSLPATTLVGSQRKGAAGAYGRGCSKRSEGEGLEKRRT